jgi:hypothetical protein
VIIATLDYLGHTWLIATDKSTCQAARSPTTVEN